MCFPGTLEALVLTAPGKPVKMFMAVRTISATLTYSNNARRQATGVQFGVFPCTGQLKLPF